MVKRFVLFSIFLFSFICLKAQQYGLFNTKTLFDSFENPAQKAFVLDSSRQFASNFFLPYLGLNAANRGDSKSALSSLINDRYYDTSNIPIGLNKRNRLFGSTNIYLFNFKVFKSYKYHKELGFSWQLRSDAFARYTNEALVVFDDYNRFEGNQTGLLKADGFGQSYHQFSVIYRENLNKRLAFGAKFSLLSGITYNSIDVSNSSLTVDQANNTVSVGLTARYQSNFLRPDELRFMDLVPTFKHPGISASFGTTYTAKSGVFIMANIKDLGFIRWNKKSHDFSVDNTVTVGRETIDLERPEYINTNTLENELERLFVDADRRGGFFTPTNAKADFMVSRKFRFYTPSLIVSKNLFYPGGDAVFVNTFKTREYSLSLSPAYNLNGFLLFGTQAMYQTPNFEFFVGSDNLFKTTAIKQETSLGGHSGASVYIGLGIKFGYVVEHPQNSSYMPGLEGDNETSFFRRIFSVFKKKK